MTSILKFVLLIFLLFAVFFIYSDSEQAFRNKKNSFFNNQEFLGIQSATSTKEKPSSSEKPLISQTLPEPVEKNEKQAVVLPKPVIIKIPDVKPAGITEVSEKSFQELMNASIIQLYCGNLNSEETFFSDISRGTGIIIDENGRIITNRHVIYDENKKKVKNYCFVLKSPFPNINSQKPRIYYIAEITNYPLLEKFSDAFSEDKYYNDFAILKIALRPNKESKINLLLGFDYALPSDYEVMENNGRFNFLPVDWDYQPKNGDALITLGYGTDASHLANKITSTIGKITGNVAVSQESGAQILLIESNATIGFSGGALVNPGSKGLIGLVSWITAGDITGKYTVAIFRDFLRSLMLQDLNIDLKLMSQNQ